MKLNVNGKEVEVNDPGNTPLLWVIRDTLGMTGTKFGCGIAQCGACTVHIDGTATRSCVTPVSAVEGKSVTTIEGLSENGDHPLQLAWLELQVPQCGYCQSGQIMQAADLLSNNANPDDAAINAAMSGNLCRCMTYKRITAAIKSAAGKMAEKEQTAAIIKPIFVRPDSKTNEQQDEMKDKEESHV